MSGAVRIPAESEAELVRRAQAGDREAFGELVVRHAPMVRRLARAILRDPEDADDAAQDAFFSAWLAIDRFDAGQKLAPWLARIAMNAAKDLRRRRAVRATEPLDAGAALMRGSTRAEADDLLLRTRLAEAIAALPERQRVAILLYEVEGYAHAEVGMLLGIPEGTVRSDVFHARRALRAALREPEGRDDDR